LGLRRALSFLHPTPEWVIVEPSPSMRRAIEKEARSNQQDLVVASELGTAIYAQAFGGLPAILDDVELGACRSLCNSDKPLLRRIRGHAHWWKRKRAVRSLMKNFQACTVVSETERQLLKDVVPLFENIELVPNCIDYSGYLPVQAVPEPHSMIFSGSLTFPANYEGMHWFLREVYPRVEQAMPDVQLRITGRHGNLPLPVGSSDTRIRLTGYIEDVRPMIAGSWISIVPLLSGGGTRLKILEAMALGTPVVSTTKGAEGLDVESGRHLLIADRPADFAAAILRVCGDSSLRAQLAKEARKLVVQRYDWSATMPKYLQLLAQIRE
jgi:glycosyltransferase involved in cell wall biosynthesis